MWPVAACRCGGANINSVGRVVVPGCIYLLYSVCTFSPVPGMPAGKKCRTIITQPQAKARPASTINRCHQTIIRRRPAINKCPPAINKCPQTIIRYAHAINKCPQTIMKCHYANNKCPQTIIKYARTINRRHQTIIRCCQTIHKCHRAISNPGCANIKCRQAMAG